MFLATLDGRERHDMFGTLGERNLGFGAAQPRLREADFRIAPKGEQLLAPVEAIFEPSKWSRWDGRADEDPRRPTICSLSTFWSRIGPRVP